MMFQRIIGFCLLILLTHCGNYRDVTSPSTPEDKNNLQSTSLDFEQIRIEILEPHCTTCHEQHSLYNRYGVVKESAFRMLERMESSSPTLRMPKNLPALPPSTIAKFKEWVLAGAPEFNNGGNDEKTKPLKTISFVDIKSRILRPYNCTSCHSQFNDFAKVKNSIGPIANLISENKMPFPQKEGGKIIPVLQEDKDYLLKWIDQGAPENSDGTTTSNLHKELQPTYISIRNNILGPKCTICHNSFGGRAPKNFDNFLELQKIKNSSPMFFDFENPNNSLIIGAILGRIEQLFFDAMPFNNGQDDIQGQVPKVTEDELKILEKWIELKLPYNENDL